MEGFIRRRRRRRFLRHISGFERDEKMRAVSRLGWDLFFFFFEESVWNSIYSRTKQGGFYRHPFFSFFFYYFFDFLARGVESVVSVSVVFFLFLDFFCFFGVLNKINKINK